MVFLYVVFKKTNEIFQPSGFRPDIELLTVQKRTIQNVELTTFLKVSLGAQDHCPCHCIAQQELAYDEFRWPCKFGSIKSPARLLTTVFSNNVTTKYNVLDKRFFICIKPILHLLHIAEMLYIFILKQWLGIITLNAHTCEHCQKIRSSVLFFLFLQKVHHD